jgi:Ca2+-transporting ATPase
MDDTKAAPGEQAPANPHAATPAEILAQLGSDATRGLSTAEASRRLVSHGRNTLPGRAQTPWQHMLTAQFASVLVGILFVAAIVSFVSGERTEALVILAIILVNGLLGFAQEWKSERALAALAAMLAPSTQVVRDGVELALPASELVPGDMVRLRTGDRVPADLRLLASVDLQLDESALTGESLAASKQPGDLPADTALARRSNCLWMGTAVLAGHATGIVIATAAHTEFGRIATLTGSVQAEQTPLQRKLAVLGGQIGAFALLIAAVVGIAGWLGGRPALEMFQTAVSLAVAVVPEGLPAVVTITLALGIGAMVRRHVLLRRLEAAEALGAATVICSDKTGTLTCNQMTAVQVWLADGIVDVSGSGYATRGEFFRAGKRIDPMTDPLLTDLLRVAHGCNNAQVRANGGTPKTLGEPTELALKVLAGKSCFDPAATRPAFAEFAFSSVRKRMTRLFDEGGARLAMCKGAPDVLLPRCRYLRDSAGERAIDSALNAQLCAAVDELAAGGMRVLALAQRRLDAAVAVAADDVEQELVLLGFVALLDPPRAEVPEAIAVAHAAGLRVVMITGDGAATARAVAQRVGLPAQIVISGNDLERMDAGQLAACLDGEPVFARTLPEQKLRIVEALQARGEVVAMTGDGVNDAPALKRADIGVAMGGRGTDVARGAADMVLTDDNFASIVGAVEEGRREYDNIQKFVRYLLSSNLGEVVAIFINVLTGFPLLLLPVQILWINLLTDSVTAIALGLEKAEPGTMHRRPVGLGDPVLSREGLTMILTTGAWIGIATLLLFHHAFDARNAASLAHAQTLAFTAMVVLETVNALNFRALRVPLRVIGWHSNRWLWAAMAGIVGLQLATVYLPPLQALLGTVPLAAGDWLLILLAALPLLLIGEWVKRRPQPAGVPEGSTGSAA